LNPQGNALKLGLDLDGIIFPGPNKSLKLSMLVFFFFGCNELEIF
jgi:hypothetical protein